MVTTQSCWSRAFAGTLIFGKEAPDILAGLGALAVLARRASGEAGLGPRVCDRGRRQADRAVPVFLRPAAGGLDHPRRRRCAGEGAARAPAPTILESNFEPRRFFANHLDFQDQLDRWAEKVNGRSHRTIRGVPAERLAKERALRPLGRVSVDTDRRWVIEGAPAAVDPGRSQRLLAGPGALPGAASRSESHRPKSPRECSTRASRPPGTSGSSRAFRRSSTPTTRSELQSQRERRRQRHEVDVEQRPLSVYDAADRMSGATSELAHLFRALKAPAAARALPASGGAGAGGVLEL